MKTKSTWFFAVAAAVAAAGTASSAPSTNSPVFLWEQQILEMQKLELEQLRLQFTEERLKSEYQRLQDERRRLIEKRDSLQGDVKNLQADIEKKAPAPVPEDNGLFIGLSRIPLLKSGQPAGEAPALTVFKVSGAPTGETLRVSFDGAVYDVDRYRLHRESEVMTSMDNRKKNLQADMARTDLSGDQKKDIERQLGAIDQARRMIRDAFSKAGGDRASEPVLRKSGK